MEYPPGFPKDLQPPVDQALAEAERAFRAAARNAVNRHDSALRGLALDFMKTAFAAFANEACKAGREGVLTGEDIRQLADEFARRMGIYLAYELLSWHLTQDVASLWSTDLEAELRQSEAWASHLEERAAVARFRSAPSDCTASPATLDTPEGRRKLVDAYIRQWSDQTGEKITKTSIWKKAGYSGPTQFLRWQRCDKERSKTAHDKFVAVLMNRSSVG